MGIFQKNFREGDSLPRPWSNITYHTSELCIYFFRNLFRNTALCSNISVQTFVLEYPVKFWTTRHQTLMILVIHLTWHGKGSMRYGWLIPGRVPTCQTEVTWGREWVRVMAYQRRGQPRSKAEWVVGFSEMDCKPFYSWKDHHPLCSQAYTKKNLFLNRIHDKYITKWLKVNTTFTKDLKLSAILLIIFCVYVLMILFSRQSLMSFYQSSPEASKRLGLKQIF